MKSLILALCAAMLLAGCAKPMEVSSITSIKPHNGSANIDVYSDQRRRGEQVPEYAGDQLMEIRSYAAESSGFRGKEFAGAKCRVGASNFSADVTTPAKVRVPIYRTKSSALSVSCTHPAYKPKLVEVSVFNRTQAQRLNAGANGGLAGVIVMAVVNGMADESNDEFIYRAAHVIMTPRPKKVARKRQ